MLIHLITILVTISGFSNASDPMQYTFETKLSHFADTGLAKFNLRYIVDDSYYKRITNHEYLRPVLFYMGN